MRITRAYSPVVLKGLSSVRTTGVGTKSMTDRPNKSFFFLGNPNKAIFGSWKFPFYVAFVGHRQPGAPARAQLVHCSVPRCRRRGLVVALAPVFAGAARGRSGTLRQQKHERRCGCRLLTPRAQARRDNPQPVRVGEGEGEGGEARSRGLSACGGGWLLGRTTTGSARLCSAAATATWRAASTKGPLVAPVPCS